MPLMMRSIAATVVTLGLMVSPAYVLGDTGGAPKSFNAMATEKLPAVVSIQTTQKAPQATPLPHGQRELPPGMQDFMERFFGEDFMDRFGGQQMPSQPMQALGSGFIVDPEGFVVTNNHVVENADAVSVHLQDGRELAAEIVGRDPKTDIAVLKVASEQPLPAIEWGNSDEALVGDWVVAIGSPFGLGSTVTAGIVSARARNIQAGPYDDFIQTDAAINRGNSGGPLIDMSGKVVGVNTAIFSPVGVNIGIGFAVPSALAKPIVQELRETGEVKRGWLGVQIQPVTEEIANAMGMEETRGALVSSVVEDSPAAKGGVRTGDVILSFAGRDIDKLRDLPIAVANAPIGESADMVVWRNGERVTLSPRIARLEDDRQEGPPGAKPDREPQILGLALEELTPESRREFGIDPGEAGVVVAEGAPDGPAAREGIEPGDLITQVGGEKVTTPEEVKTAVEKARDAGRKSVLLMRRRGDNQSFVALPIKAG